MKRRETGGDWSADRISQRELMNLLTSKRGTLSCAVRIAPQE